MERVTCAPILRLLLKTKLIVKDQFVRKDKRFLHKENALNVDLKQFSIKRKTNALNQHVMIHWNTYFWMELVNYALNLLNLQKISLYVFLNNVKRYNS